MTLWEFHLLMFVSNRNLNSIAETFAAVVAEDGHAVAGRKVILHHFDAGEEPSPQNRKVHGDPSPRRAATHIADARSDAENPI